MFWLFSTIFGYFRKCTSGNSDARTYSVNIHNKQFWDLTWMDLWQYPLYTRGGPYWQEYVIPYSKFILSSKGCIQDKQSM